MGSVSRVHTFASAAVLTAAQLNNEFDNLLTSSAINGGLDATNLGVTAGQITASKAIVVDGSRNLDDGTASNQINNLVLSGTLTVAGATTQTGALSIDDTTNSTSTTTGSIHTDGGVGIALDLVVGDDVKLLTDSSVLSLGVGSDATLTHDGTTGLTIAANPITVDSGDALTLDAHTGIVIFKDAGSEVLRFTEGNSGDVTIKLATNGKDLIFTDNGDATGLKVLDAAVGINVPGEVQTTKIAYTDGDDAITIADGGGVTTSGTLATTGAATLASLVCTAAGTFGGGYGATGATISTLGVLQANGAITSDGAVTGATLAGTVSTAAQNSITSASSLATVGTITTGTWQGTKVASAYLDDQTAHLNVTQSFTGAKTFGAATQFNSTVTIGVNDTGYDVQLFGATDGSNILWDQSADDLIFTNAGIAVGSDATGDIYYRDASGFLARLAASTDGHVLTTGGAGTIPAFEALPSGGSFSGPGSATDNAVVRFNGTGGATGQNSGLIVDDSNNVTGAANVTLSGELDAATGDFSGDVDVDGTLETDALTIGGTALLANDTNNRVTTATGSGTFNGEANLTFDGSTLALADGRTLLVGGTSAVTTSVTATSQILGTTSADTSLMIGRWSADNDHAHIYFAKSRNATVGSSTIVQDDDHLGAVHFMADDGTDFNSEAASIRAQIDGTPGSNDVPGRLIFATTADGAASPTERMRIDSAGDVSIASLVKINVSNTGVAIGTTSTPASTWTKIGANGGDVININGGNGNVGINEASPSARLYVKESVAGTGAQTNYKNNESATNTLFWGACDRASNSAFDFFRADSDVNGSSNREFTLNGAGNAYAEGTWNSSGADYQEWFESADGTEYEIGKAVVLDGDKVRVYNAATDSADNIFGVTRPQAENKNSALTGNTAWNHWTDKYLTDDWGVYIREDYTVWEWDDVLAAESDVVEAVDATHYEEGDDIPDGKSEGDTKTEAVEGVAVGDVKIEAGTMASYKIPEGWTPPANATTVTQSMRKLNPEYSVEVDDETNYTPRADRTEWNLIGLLGQVQIKASEPTNPRWLKMKDISDAVEMWMIR